MNLEEFFRAKGREFKEVAGGSELLVHCRRGECQGKDKATLYVNKATGMFYCQRCSYRGRLVEVDGAWQVQGDGGVQGSEMKGMDSHTGSGLNGMDRKVGRLDKDFVDAMHQALQLPGFAHAMKYLEGRGLSQEVIMSYKLGYSPSLNAISIPNLDLNGAAVSIKYRFLSGEQRYGQESLGGQAQLPYGLWKLAEPRTGVLHITEGEFDALSLAQLEPGSNVIALPGKNSFPKSKKEDTSGILQYLKNYSRIYLYPDRELRANLDFLRHAETLGAARCTVVRLPAAVKDLNEALTLGLSSEDIEKARRQAETGMTTQAYAAAEDLFEEALESLKKVHEEPGMSTGLAQLDTCMGGVHAGDLTILAGEGGAGKTTIATQIGLELLKQGAVVLIGSYEMSPAKAILPRMLSLVEGRNLFVDKAPDKIQRPGIFDRLFFLAPGVVDITVGAVSGHIAEIYQQEKLTVAKMVYVIIDNLSRFRIPVAHKESDYLRAQEEQVVAIKNLTRLYPNMHICLLAHLNKSSDGGMTKNRIRGSAVIGAEADNIMLIDKQLRDGVRGALHVDKIRFLGGRDGERINLNYDWNTTRFSEVEADGEY